MIEDLFPKTVGNILDYDAIKLAAKQYVEDVFVNIVQEFADNMTLYTMDAAHLADVSGHVAGDSSLSLEQLLDYINAENIYHECDFVSELLATFPEGVEYKEFDVTGWGFPESDLFPFNNVNRSFHLDGTPTNGQDTLWGVNALDNLPERNLLMSRYKGQFNENDDPQWHRKEGRRSSWGNSATWMTSGGFGKPATIHINVDEERTVIEGNGLTAVENWLGTVSNKLPINLYIEIESHFVTNAEPASSSLEGYHMAFPYEEEEGFCTNDQNMAVTLNNATPPTPPPPPPPPEPSYSYIVFDTTTGTIVHSIVDEGMVFSQVGYVLMDETGNMITVYETGVKTESFYFTTNGRNETQNTNISHADIPVYLEDGTAPAADTPYNGASVLAFMDVTGNTKRADGESLYVDDGELRLDAPDTDEGEQWAALVEYIEPAPPASSFDSATGTISALTLPTAHSGSYTNVTFDALRYYVKGIANGLSSTVTSLFGRASRAWYYGTIVWTDESLGDLSSLIQVNPTSSDHLVQQTVFRIIFVYDAYISGFHPYDTGDSAAVLNQITAYSYNNGVHSITFYCTESWINTIYTGRIQFRYLDGTTTFNGLDAYDLILVNNGALSKATTTDRYDMYNAWGGQISIKSYYPQPPAPSELTAYFTNQGAAGTEDTFIQNGVTHTLYDSSGATIPYDPSKTYTKILLYKFDGTEMSPNGVTALDSDQGWCDTILKVRANGNKYVYKLTYTVS